MDHDIVIVGAGIAGLSAALTAARLGRSTAIFTGTAPGGELLNIELVDGIPGQENGIAGFDLAPIAQEQAAAAGARFVTEPAISIEPAGEGWKVTGTNEALTARAVILAMGATVRKLGVPGEEEFTGSGVSHCATCDGPLLRGKVAVVAGGGDSGMQEALTLAQHCEKVVIVEREAALTGQPTYREAVEANPAIEIVCGNEISAIEGETKVEKVILRDASGNESTIDASGVFSFIGLEPCTALTEGLVELAADGRIAVDAGMRTSARGILAIGNLRSGNGWRAAAAMGDGACAAMTATGFLDTGAWQ